MQPAPARSKSLLRAWSVRASLVAAAVGLLALTAPEVITATFSSPGTFLRVAGLTAALVLWSVLAGRFVPNRWAKVAVVTVPVLAVSFWQLRPYYVEDLVDEAFPVAAAASAPQQPGSVDAGATPIAGEDTTAAPATGAPTALSDGRFQGLTGHRGAGTATAFALADGAQLVRLTEFDISNGPGLELYLVPRADARDVRDGVKVADLKGNRGDQNYAVPKGLDLSSGTWTVLIWCAPFTVEVANATLT